MATIESEHWERRENKMRFEIKVLQRIHFYFKAQISEAFNQSLEETDYVVCLGSENSPTRLIFPNRIT